MPKATKIVIHFDDGTSYDIDPASAGSIFTSEAKAKKCNHNPPYGKPPKGGGTAGGGTAADTTTAAALEGTCYFINGVIVCP